MFIDKFYPAHHDEDTNIISLFQIFSFYLQHSRTFLTSTLLGSRGWTSKAVLNSPYLPSPHVGFHDTLPNGHVSGIHHSPHIMQPLWCMHLYFSMFKVSSNDQHHCTPQLEWRRHSRGPLWSGTLSDIPTILTYIFFTLHWTHSELQAHATQICDLSKDPGYPQRRIPGVIRRGDHLIIYSLGTRRTVEYK